MAKKLFISSEDKIITSDFLCFLQNKLLSTANDDIVTACCNFYGDEYIQQEKELFYSALGKKPPRPRVADKKAKDVNDLLQEMRHRDDIGEWQPSCVAADLGNLPQSEIGNVSNSQIFDSLLSLRKNVVSRSEFNFVLSELKNELIVTMKGCIRPASYSSPRRMPQAPSVTKKNVPHSIPIPVCPIINVDSSAVDDNDKVDESVCVSSGDDVQFPVDLSNAAMHHNDVGAVGSAVGGAARGAVREAECGAVRGADGGADRGAGANVGVDCGADADADRDRGRIAGDIGGVSILDATRSLANGGEILGGEILGGENLVSGGHPGGGVTHLQSEIRSGDEIQSGGGLRSDSGQGNNSSRRGDSVGRESATIRSIIPIVGSDSLGLSPTTVIKETIDANVGSSSGSRQVISSGSTVGNGRNRPVNASREIRLTRSNARSGTRSRKPHNL